jgi:predicted TIM-barrel fold metal-dependent hydrolase
VQHPLIDVNCWLGSWPFQRFDIRSAGDLADHLEKRGVVRALVSHLGAVFYADVDAYNRELFEACSGVDTLLPVPVINPAVPGWRDDLDAYGELIELRAVRILPSFHNYALFSEPTFELVERLEALGATLFVQMRMQDERNAYHGMDVTAPAVTSIVRLHRTHPDVEFICLSAYLPEVQQIGRTTDTVSVDISFSEWLFTMEELLSAISAERVFFGSHTPLLYTGAITRKLLDAEIPEAAKEAIGSENACRQLRICLD